MRFPIHKNQFWKHAVLMAWIAPYLLAQAPQASIQGIIVSAENAPAPIAGATVEIRRVDGSEPQTYRATTSGDGSFRVENIRPGEYRLLAIKSGFLPWEYGQRRWNLTGTRFTLEPGQNVQGVEVRLVRAGVIHGRLSDRRGIPAGAAEVFALVPVYRNGMRTLTVFQSTVSDDRGYYRLFSLPPGTYYVSAVPFAGTGIILSSIVDGNTARLSPGNEVFRQNATLGLTYLPHYYPGVTDARRASAIEIRPGATFSGADFIVQPSPTRHIRGATVRGRAVTLVLAPLFSVPGAGALTTVANVDTGAFQFQGVAPGAYMLVANTDDGSSRQILEVGETDLENVGVALGGGFTIPGRVRIDNRTPIDNDPDMDHIYFDFVSEPALPGIPSSTYSPRYDGSFALRNLAAGNYRITNFSTRGSAPGLQNAYIKSIRIADQDVLHRGLQVNGPIDGMLEVVIGTMPSSVSGVVVNEERQPVGNAIVVLALDTPSRAPLDLYRTTVTDAAGRFRLTPVPPGNFKVFAWTDIETGAWQDPELMRQHEDYGIPVSVRENSNPSVELVAR